MYGDLTLQPYVGATVHYVSHFEPHEHIAAVITKVHGDVLVDLTVWHPGWTAGEPKERVGLSHDPVGGTWHWAEKKSIFDGYAIDSDTGNVMRYGAPIGKIRDEFPKLERLLENRGPTICRRRVVQRTQKPHNTGDPCQGEAAMADVPARRRISPARF